jgi:hypothetical protein
MDASMMPFHQLSGTASSSPALLFFDEAVDVADFDLARADAVVVAVAVRSRLSA